MFKKYLIDDCRRIFGYKKIIFGSVDSGKEQDALYIDIDNVKENPLPNIYSFVIDGKLGALGTKEGNPYGFLLGRLKQAAKKQDLRVAVGRFLIYGKEEDIKFLNYEGYFTQTIIRFKWRISLQYDPAPKTTGFIAKIRSFFK